MVHSSVLLEACIENTMRLPLNVEYVRFDPAPLLSVKAIQCTSESGLSEECSDPALMDYLEGLKVSFALSGQNCTCRCLC